MTVMTTGTGGFSSAAVETGPVAGLDPLLDFRRKLARSIKDHPYAQQYKQKRQKAKKIREEIDRHNHQTAHLYQYKINIPTVGETIIFGSSEAELRMKLRLLVNPRYQGNISIERIFPSDAGKFYNNKRIKAYKNLPEATMMKKEADPAEKEAAAAQDAMAKKSEAMKSQAAAQQVQAKIAIEKKKIELKKQEMQKALMMKISAMKKGASAGTVPVATESVIHESSGGNIDLIKKIADSNQPGSIQFLNGEKFQIQPAIAQKIFQAYESLGMQKNKAKFSNAANETATSFQKILTFVGAAG